MIEVDKEEVVGFEHAIRGMRNPMNSWEKSDSSLDLDGIFRIGPDDYTLMKKLAKAGTDHRKFMRMIAVYCDINAPLYWWKEFDTYKVGTVANSCSTMHKVAAKEFTIEDFSYENLINVYIFKETIACMNSARDLYLQTKDKQYWWQMIQMLPSSYNQKRTVMMNYEVLANIYHNRKNHKLDEWHVFSDWIKKLPYSELITEEKQMESRDKEVYFNEYCKTCAFENKKESEEPCNTCLEYPSNTDSHKPVGYKEK